MTRRERLMEFVTIQHGRQVRKYTGDPYIVHLFAVARTAEEAGAQFGFEIGLCHDLVEDVEGFTNEMLWSFLESTGYSQREVVFICDGVFELTDEFTHEDYPDMNRKARKRAEAERQGTISPNSQTIKYCDLIDNSHSIVESDPGFAQIYLEEKERILTHMTGGSPEKFKECKELLEKSKKTIDEHFLQLGLEKLVHKD